jgi:peroxidase
VGKAHCFSITKQGVNPNLNPSSALKIHEQCRALGPSSTVPNDPITPNKVDLQYFVNLKAGNSLFRSDHSLYVDNNKTRDMVDSFLTDANLWAGQFGVSMINLGNILPDAALPSQIRRHCGFINPAA